MANFNSKIINLAFFLAPIVHCGRCAEPTPSTVQKDPRKCDRTCRDNSAEPALRERLLENVTEVVAGMAHDDASQAVLIDAVTCFESLTLLPCSLASCGW